MHQWEALETGSICVHALRCASCVQARMLLEDPGCADAILAKWHPLLEKTLNKWVVTCTAVESSHAMLLCSCLLIKPLSLTHTLTSWVCRTMGWAG